MHQPSITAASRIRSARRRGLSNRILGTGLALVLGVSVFTGCTPDEPKPTPTPTDTAQAEAGITDITDTPGSGEGLVGALADTKVTTCELADGEWNVAGTVANSSESSASYRIYVSLLTTGGDTRSLTQVNIDPIDPAAETEWSTTVPLDEKDLNCVLRVERYAAAADQPLPEETEGAEG